MQITYQIEFYSYWHAGSGLGAGAYADNTVNKNEEQLPVIPGRTIKGLLREAAVSLNQLDEKLVTQQFIKDVFGVDSSQNDNLLNNKENEGKAFFTNACLSKYLSEQIVSEDLSADLYHVISSTRIDENGQADDGSLRQLEVTVPVTLYGNIEHFPDSTYVNQLEACFKWIKQMGQNRNRGLGKCKFSIVKK